MPPLPTVALNDIHYIAVLCSGMMGPRLPVAAFPVLAGSPPRVTEQTVSPLAPTHEVAQMGTPDSSYTAASQRSCWQRTRVRRPRSLLPPNPGSGNP